MSSKMAKAGSKTKSSTNRKPQSKQTTSVSAQRLREMVTSIGFRVTGFKEGRQLKLKGKALGERLGGKGAGLVEMNRLGLPVPPAINLSTELCNIYLLRQQLPEALMPLVQTALRGMEKKLSQSFGDKENPLLLSVRSGAPVSMPGMMDTILNLGLTQEIVESLGRRYPEAARFWWDCYRRFIVMFSDVVLQVDREIFERELERSKREEAVREDSKLSAEALRSLCEIYLEQLGSSFPQDPNVQLKLAIEAVFRSWNTERAVHYREMNSIPAHWGTAVNVQAMVFGNRNDQSATGVAFTRNPSTGEKEIYGEFLVNAQGEDVVAGIRTPEAIEDLANCIPKAGRELFRWLKNLEKNYKEVQDVEFTIDDGRLFILQTRNAKRTASAAVSHLHQFVKEKVITRKEALERLSFDQVKQMLHPSLKPTEAEPLGRGLPASPGAVSGKIALDPETAVQWRRAEQKVILVRKETSPEDILGMSVSEGILTATGGMTSHAAVVGRGMGKACVVGCQALRIDEAKREIQLGEHSLKEGEEITLNGSTGEVYAGELPTEAMSWSAETTQFFRWADEAADLLVLANADTPLQAQTARDLGAQGIGLCRTEHMFFDADRLRDFRKMILSDSSEQRESFLKNLEKHQTEDFYGLFGAMKDLSVCVRLLDPPLHEFLPHIEEEEELRVLASELSLGINELKQRIESLRETNPMLGHRGCRLAITFPEIYRMQVRALFNALHRHQKHSKKTICKIMIPLVMDARELDLILKDLKSAAQDEVEGLPRAEQKTLLSRVQWGTMIELPRACLVADKIAEQVDFISFGTNDLTQTCLGISRDDSNRFLPDYISREVFANEPFESLDVNGVGALVSQAVQLARRANKKIEIGVCGEHGGEPKSVAFFQSLKFDSVSCSPFRVPIARLAAARAKSESMSSKRRGKK